ncbi:hypothetical protein CIB48_g9914 [Xylaria polymorpha]|nr:hypothetical protein CIB48_g9914 [Xylaria polymorpha]
MVSAVGTFFIVLAVLLVVAAVASFPAPILVHPLRGLLEPVVLRSAAQSRRRSRVDKRPVPVTQEPALGSWRIRAQRLRRRRGFGPLDPDDAWDARVGHETYGVGAPYYPDDQELEDRGHHGGRGAPYSGSDYQMNLAGDGVDENRGRSPNPRLDVSASKPAAGEGSHHSNPFDDAAAEPSNLSLRGVSPRPIDTRKAAAAPGPPPHDSPTSVAERRSIFREDI